MANRRADLVVSSLLKYVTDIDEVKGLGFCVSIEHAEFMCRYFNSHRIPSIFLTGKSSDEERKTAKGRLVNGEIRFIFVVDIYNEGGGHPGGQYGPVPAAHRVFDHLPSAAGPWTAACGG